ncbi:rhodanese-like domain-containing protein [Alkalihalobacillus sp. R86527]|uniref:rhodanese-like domain-containing protein n=1 Tax=Alkalihalobacillus sp. R86527 TaxID=3093863 RepID=UPI00366CCD8B
MEFIVIIAVVVLASLFLKRSGKGVTTINSEQAKSKFGYSNVQFIDVRTPMEYKGSKVKEFKNLPLDQLGKRAKELDPKKETVVLCQSGMRSSRACKVLKQQGFTSVYNVRGGLNTWR